MNNHTACISAVAANFAIMFLVIVCVWISERRVGTKSLLFGVHQFAWHPITVALAWRRLYGAWPNWREAVCILIHDCGYWGCPEMDGEQGEMHPRVGARIAKRLFGDSYHDLVMWHSRHLSKKWGVEPSKLCWADKLSMIYDPQWFYLLRARMSGEIHEYRRHATAHGFVPAGATDAEWHSKLVNHLKAVSLARSYLISMQARNALYVQCVGRGTRTPAE